MFITSFSWFSIVVITLPFSNEIFRRVWWILGNSKFPRLSQFIFFESLELYWVGFLYNLLKNATTYKSFKVSLIKKQKGSNGFFNEYLLSWSTGTISTWVDSLRNWWEGDIHTIWSSNLKKACCTCSCNVIWNNDLDPIRQNKETTRVYV